MSPTVWPPQLPATYRYDWALFRDWCQAIGEPALPTSPAVIRGFLAAHPAAPETHRRRLAAIRAAHVGARYSRPRLEVGDRPTIGAAPRDPARAREVLALLPTRGWPAGLWGRRDGLLIVLTQLVGLPAALVSRLQRSQVRVEQDQADRLVLVVDDERDRWETIATPDDPGACPVAVYLQWARLQAVLDQVPARWAVAEWLAQQATDPEAAGQAPYRPVRAPRRDGPLVPPIDRWGALDVGQWDPARGLWVGLSAEAIIAAVDAVMGSPVTRPRPGLPIREPDDPDEPDVLEDEAGETEDPVLSPHDPAIGLAKRAAAVAAGDELDELFDQIDRMTDELTERTAAILDQLDT